MISLALGLLVVAGCGDKDTTSDDTGSGSDDTGGDTNLNSLTWGASAITAPDTSNWLGAYVADEDNIWILAGGGVTYFDGASWTLSAQQDQFGFDPNAPDMTIFFDPWAISGSSTTDVYVVCGNSMIASFDGTSWTQLSNGYGPEDLNTYQPLLSPGSMWASGSGAAYHLSRGGDYNFVTWDGSTRTTTALDTMVGNLDYAPHIVWGLDDNDIWVGGALTSLFNSPIHHWDGSSWSRATIEAGDEGRVVGFWGTAADDMWMAVTGNQYGSKLYRSASNGGWELADTRPVDGTDNPVYYDIWGTSNSNIFVGGNQGLFRYNGTDWTEIDLGADAAGLAVLRIHGITASKLVVEVGNSTEKAFYLVEGL
ncbi:MAG: hypothetical protein H6739_04555 [Alphaproteobacteria bacterium]|nr:hypothetical protein [Alphaproteobacteria bacterium]